MLKKIRNNIVFTTIRRILALLSPAEKRRGFRMVFATLLGALLDVLGLAFMVPVMLAATNPEFIQESDAMRWVQETSGLTDYPSFMMFLAVMLLIVFIVKNSIALLLHYHHSSFSFSVATSVARRQFIKYYQKGFQFFKSTNSAEIINNIVNVPTLFASGVLISAINMVAETMVMLFIVVGIAIIDTALFFAVMGALIPSGIIIYNASKNKLYRLGQEQQELAKTNFSRLNQSIFGYVDVKLTNREQHFLDTYIQSQGKFNNNQKIKYLISLIPTRGLEVIAILGIVVIFAYSFYFSGDQDQLFGFIALFAAAAFRVLPSMNRLLNAMMGMKNHSVALDILEDGGLPNELEKVDITPLPFHDHIEFRNIGFSYDRANVPALRNLSFTVPKGEKIGIIGESGSGKTTLVNLLLRFLEEGEGGIYVDGVKLTKDNTPGWRAIVGYVQQRVYLMDATIRENVAFGEKPENIDDERVVWAMKQAKLWDYVSTLEKTVHTRIGENGQQLSGGQQQRVGIARALYWNSEVLVFDEATSSLDSETETAITESIEGIASGQTLFVIAHRITTLKHCDRILEFKHGQLVGEWKYDDLIREKL